MKLPDLRDFDLNDKRIVLRVDLDVPLHKKQNRDGSFEYRIEDETRLETFVPTAKLLLEKKVKAISLIGHIGRYGEGEKGISTFCLWPTIGKLLNVDTSFWPDVLVGNLGERFNPSTEDGIVQLHENLRMYKGEEENDNLFAQNLAKLGDFYVNDAFATCHREHASIVGLPRLLPHAAGLSLLNEVETLSKVQENPRGSLVVILGGAKIDKLDIIEALLPKVDYILIGGKLPLMIEDRKWKTSDKVVVGELNQCQKDITLRTVERFEGVIDKAGTIVWAGPLGMFEEKDWELGTKIVGEAVVSSKAFTVVGGGDTEAALTKLSLVDQINFVSSGGGAMLDFLAGGDLVGLKALRS